MSASELAEVMQHSAIGVFWPRARSKLFEEPRKLVAHGLAVSDAAPSGRVRTVYSITEKGRSALRDWVRQPTAPINLEAEIALKVSFADAVDPSDLIATLSANQEAALDEILGRREIMEKFAEGGFRFPDHAHASALVAALTVFTARAMVEWRQWVARQVSVWDDMSISDDKQEWATDVYRVMLEEMDRVAEMSDGFRTEGGYAPGPALLPDFDPGSL